jgi:hypothetical protein
MMPGMRTCLAFTWYDHNGISRVNTKRIWLHDMDIDPDISFKNYDRTA